MQPWNNLTRRDAFCLDLMNISRAAIGILRNQLNMFLPEYNLRIYLKNGWASEGAEAAVGQRNFSLK